MLFDSEALSKWVNGFSGCHALWRAKLLFRKGYTLTTNCGARLASTMDTELDFCGAATHWVLADSVKMMEREGWSLVELTADCTNEEWAHWDCADGFTFSTEYVTALERN